jgi:hypothetical protein
MISNTSMPDLKASEISRPIASVLVWVDFSDLPTVSEFKRPAFELRNGYI